MCIWLCGKSYQLALQMSINASFECDVLSKFKPVPLSVILGS